MNSDTSEDSGANAHDQAIEQARNIKCILLEMEPDEKIIITDHDRAVAGLVSSSPKPTEKAPRKLGFLSGSVISISSDFDEPLDDMQEYMQ